MMDPPEEGKVECFDRNDSMMDSAWGAGKSFHQMPLEGEPPRETGMGAGGGNKFLDGGKSRSKTL